MSPRRKSDPAAPRRVGERAMARELLAVRGRCAIVSHVRPDGDAVGSSLGLCRALRAAGRQSAVKSTPGRPFFMPTAVVKTSTAPAA